MITAIPITNSKASKKPGPSAATPVASEMTKVKRKGKEMENFGRAIWKICGKKNHSDQLIISN